MILGAGRACHIISLLRLFHEQFYSAVRMLFLGKGNRTHNLKSIKETVISKISFKKINRLSEMADE